MQNTFQTRLKNLLTILFAGLILMWTVFMFVPFGVLMYKLTRYLIEAPFREWHTVLLWIFVIPTTTMIVFVVKIIKKPEGKI